MEDRMLEQRILFMSGSDMLVRLLEENLDNEMYEVEILDCEVKGVESIEMLYPDLILLDVEGEEQRKRWDFLNAVKNHDATANIPVLLCTDASQELREQERDFQMLNIQLLYKPFNKEDLLETLRQIVQPLSSAFEAANAHKRDISMPRSAVNLLSSLVKEVFPRWTSSLVASAKQRFNEGILPDFHLQEQIDRPEAEGQREQENLLEQIDKSDEPLEAKVEEQQAQKQGNLPGQTDQLEARREKGVEEQQEQEQENQSVPEEQTCGILSIAR